MKLQQKLSEFCPTCGCRTVVCEGTETTPHTTKLGREIRQHTNGQRWDFREFLCGCRVKWVPNYNSEQTTDVCRKDPEYIETQKAILALDNQIRDLEDQKRRLDTR